MDALSLDQLRVLLAVADHGSFSAAARTLRRAQSAVTYAVQRMEEQVGVALFDRTAYRPVLTEAGRALLPRARRISDEVAALHAQARGIAGGLEPELSIVVETLFPMCRLVSALAAFSQRHPTVTTRLFVENLGAATALLVDGTCAIGLLPLPFAHGDDLVTAPVLEVEMLPLAAPSHPLAAFDGLIPADALSEHVQLVLTDRSERTKGRDFNVLSTRTWRLGDLGAKRALLLAGLGWGSLPQHVVEDDLAEGRLVALRPADLAANGGRMRLPFVVAHPRARPLGPAGTWMFDEMTRQTDWVDAAARPAPYPALRRPASVRAPALPSLKVV